MESLWGAALGFTNPYTLLPLAAHDLGRGVADAGLLEASLFAGCGLVQLASAYLFSPRWTEPGRAAWMHAPALALTLALGLAMAVPMDPGLRWALLLGGVTLHWVGVGVVVPHWATLTARNIPPRYLGRYFGWCFSGAGLCGTAAGVLAAGWVARGGLGWGYAACFGAAFALQSLSAWLLSRTRPLLPAPDVRPPLGPFLSGRLAQAVVRPWPLFWLVVICVQFASASTQLFTSCLKDAGASDAAFRFFNPAIGLGGMAGSLALGWLMDRRGPAWALAAALFPLLAGLALLSGDRGTAAGTAAFAIAGLFNAVFGSVLLPWMLRLAPASQRTAYAGFYGTFTAPWTFLAPWALGRLASSRGYAPVFAVSAASALAALAFLALLPKGPRTAPA